MRTKMVMMAMLIVVSSLVLGGCNINEAERIVIWRAKGVHPANANFAARSKTNPDGTKDDFIGFSESRQGITTQDGQGGVTEGHPPLQPLKTKEEIVAANSNQNSDDLFNQ